ncbi:hypothetical protein B0G52_103244 [Cohnella sp. SGD-V74]|nr:hypothetical protein B0G52_103244 [Cohnella sp. SGD-V74]
MLTGAQETRRTGIGQPTGTQNGPADETQLDRV